VFERVKVGLKGEKSKTLFEFKYRFDFGFGIFRDKKRVWKQKFIKLGYRGMRV
jgi:hypothetical protein